MAFMQAPWTILVIDDHGLFRSGVKLILEACFPRTRVVAVETVAAARDIADLLPNLILLDVLLRDDCSLDHIPELKQRWPDCVIVVVSGDDTPATKAAALAQGAQDYLRKASDPSEMLHLIKAVYDRQTGQDSVKKIVLTARQQEIFAQLQQGKSNKAIAANLNLSEFTVRGHVQAILKTLGVQSRSAAVFEYQRRSGHRP
jgi:DNA-binding NarL/FixJ family response regulator